MIARDPAWTGFIGPGPRDLRPRSRVARSTRCRWLRLTHPTQQAADGTAGPDLRPGTPKPPRLTPSASHRENVPSDPRPERAIPAPPVWRRPRGAPRSRGTVLLSLDLARPWRPGKGYPSGGWRWRQGPRTIAEPEFVRSRCLRSVAVGVVDPHIDADHQHDREDHKSDADRELSVLPPTLLASVDERNGVQQTEDQGDEQPDAGDAEP